MNPNRTAAKGTWTNTRGDALRASSGLIGAVKTIVGQLPNIDQVRVLHRDSRVSKFFIILKSPSIQAIDQVVAAMVQIEEAFGPFDYDTVPTDKLVLVPDDATTLGNG